MHFNWRFAGPFMVHMVRRMIIVRIKKRHQRGSYLAHRS